MRKDMLKTIQNDLLYSKKKVIILGNNANRCAHYTNAANSANRTDENLTDRISKFQDKLKIQYV